MYIRGRTLFDTYFEKPTTTNLPTLKKTGRNSDLNFNRNEYLIFRFYYYSTFFGKKLSYNFIIKEIAKEQFLSPTTIAEIITNNFHLLDKVKKQEPSLKELSKKYPHIVWDPKYFLLKDLH